MIASFCSSKPREFGPRDAEIGVNVDFVDDWTVTRRNMDAPCGSIVAVFDGGMVDVTGALVIFDEKQRRREAALRGSSIRKQRLQNEQWAEESAKKRAAYLRAHPGSVLEHRWAIAWLMRSDGLPDSFTARFLGLTKRRVEIINETFDARINHDADRRFPL